MIVKVHFQLEPSHKTSCRRSRRRRSRLLGMGYCCRLSLFCHFVSAEKLRMASAGGVSVESKSCHPLAAAPVFNATYSTPPLAIDPPSLVPLVEALPSKRIIGKGYRCLYPGRVSRSQHRQSGYYHHRNVRKDHCSATKLISD